MGHHVVPRHGRRARRRGRGGHRPRGRRRPRLQRPAARLPGRGPRAPPRRERRQGHRAVQRVRAARGRRGGHGAGLAHRPLDRGGLEPRHRRRLLPRGDAARRPRDRG
ncbi:hypothetical protein [Clavibacter tessellarius]|uniref:hypothetical protein n=1 Tax=Clavibacter tessellarius TaxID=31965 RepID=UPI0039BFA25A